MNKLISQIAVAIVCGILGFLLTYQFRLLAINENSETYYSEDILAEIESLKIEKEELLNTNQSLSDKVASLEATAAKNGNYEAEAKKDLDNARMQLGLLDVKGPGITITLTEKTSIFGTNTTESTKKVSEDEIVSIVNFLWYAGAEAISVNDIRITPQTGIKTSGNYVSLGAAGRIDPTETMIIKAIGDKVKLDSAANFGDSLSYGALKNYDAEVKALNDIVINKTTQSLENNFITPIKPEGED